MKNHGKKDRIKITNGGKLNLKQFPLNVLKPPISTLLVQSMNNMLLTYSVL